MSDSFATRQAPLSIGLPRQEDCTGVSCHFLLQGIFPIQGSNPGLLHWQVDSLPLSHQGSLPICKMRIIIKDFWTIFCLVKLGLTDMQWLSGKESTCQCRRHVSDPWVGKIPWRRKWQTHSSILAWKIPWSEEPGGLQSMGWQRVRHDWAPNTFPFHRGPGMPGLRGLICWHIPPQAPQLHPGCANQKQIIHWFKVFTYICHFRCRLETISRL